MGKYSRKKKQQVQRSWGKNELGVQRRKKEVRVTGVWWTKRLLGGSKVWGVVLVIYLCSWKEVIVFYLSQRLWARHSDRGWWRELISVSGSLEPQMKDSKARDGMACSFIHSHCLTVEVGVGWMHRWGYWCGLGLLSWHGSFQRTSVLRKSEPGGSWILFTSNLGNHIASLPLHSIRQKWTIKGGELDSIFWMRNVKELVGAPFKYHRLDKNQIMKEFEFYSNYEEGIHSAWTPSQACSCWSCSATSPMDSELCV